MNLLLRIVSDPHPGPFAVLRREGRKHVEVLAGEFHPKSVLTEDGLVVLADLAVPLLAAPTATTTPVKLSDGR
jgi:hypothetical protein